MDTPRPQKVARRLPLITIIVVVISVIATHSSGLGSALIFSRDSTLHGDVWRLISGHLVHLSTEHLAYNLAAFAVLGIIVERHYRTHLIPLLLTLALSISAALLLSVPDLDFYGGLSGVNFGLLTFLATLGLLESGAWRGICIAALALVVAKLGFEITTGRSILPYLAPQPFQLVPVSHLVGSVVGVIFGGYRMASRGDESV